MAEKSDKACYSSYGSPGCCWSCAQRSGKLCELKRDTNRTRRRAEAAVIAQQVADSAGDE